MSARGRRVLLLGGTSEIGLAIVQELAGKGAIEVLLAGRDGQALEQAAQRLRAAGCERVLSIDSLEATDTAGHGQVLDRAFAELGGVDVAILAVGVLGQRGGLAGDVPAAVEVLHVNVCGAGSLLMGVAARLRAQGGGTAIVLSSVAAERPRRSNAVYGASKAGIDSLSQALSDALRPDGVEVIVVRPGFVRTRMTRGLSQPPLSCDPQDVARATVAGLERGAQTVWAPPAIRWAMLALRLLPRPIFRRLSL
jgi:decaprenylphospho-beta-D-erythro-pentofuranosid-2-ulose 2-reductase